MLLAQHNPQLYRAYAGQGFEHATYLVKSQGNYSGKSVEITYSVGSPEC